MQKRLHNLRLKGLIPILASFILFILLSSQIFAEPAVPENPEGEGCYTQILYDLKYGQNKDVNACSPMGACDDPGLRNSNIPDPADPLKYIRIYFHVFREDDGGNPAATEQNVADAVEDINGHYLPLRIQFEYEMRFINSTAYRYLNANNEFNQMKNAYAISPDSQLNVFVSSVHVDGSVSSYGTFPWDGVALSNTGGIVMNNTQFPPYNDRTLTHEIGHNLGLWHTFHGVSEVTECGPCFEPPNHPENDLRGDFCSDTEPAPRNWSCGPYGGNDPCEDTPWGSNEWNNHMSYSPCRFEFSPQQWGRMHCWTEDILSSWLNNVSLSADTVFGEVPLDVQFTGSTPKVVLDWSWEFGDGDIDDIQHPSHLYDEPGLFDVRVTINAEDGTYITERNDYIWVYADTMVVTEVEGQPGDQAKVDIYVNNHVPLKILTIPVSWNGDYDMDLDSFSVVGLRTEYADQVKQVHSDSWLKRGTFQILTSVGTYTPDLAPDTGSVLSLYFSIPPSASGDPNPVEIISYSSYQPLFSLTPGIFTPEIVAGSVGICTGGDTDNDGIGPNVADLIYLVDYIFRGGPPPPIPASGDVDGDGLVNVADLSYLVDYIFKGGPVPEC